MEKFSILRFIITKSGFHLDQPIDPTSNLQKQFQDHRYETLYHWGFQEQEANLHPSALFLHRVSEAFIHALTSLPELEIAREECLVEVSEELWQSMQPKIPYILGSEFINKEWLAIQFSQLQEVYAEEIRTYDGQVKVYLAEKSQKLRTPERIFFHLVENKESPFPFAFMATYATKTEDGKVRHMPLKYALEEFKQEREKLLALLSCLNKAADVCELLSEFVQSGELFHPLQLTSQEAYEILKHVEAIENCGILCRIPNWWRRKYSSIAVNVKLGEKKPSLLGFDSLIAMQPVLMVDGVELTKTDIKNLLQ